MGIFRTPARRAEAALLVVTLCWGVTFPLIKGALGYTGPLTFVALRFPLALVMMWPLLRFRIPARSTLIPGGLLGFLLAGSLYAQTLGLVTTTPTRSAFITGLSVILIPILYPVFTRRLPGRWPVAGAATATVGLFLLTGPGSGGVARGDLITLGCAVGFAIYIILIEVLTRRHPFRDLVLVQFLILAVVFAPAALAAGEPLRWGPALAWGLAVTGPVFAFTNYLQNRFQRDTTATRAGVIFTAEPVFASFFSFLILGETLTAVQWLGGGFIVAGILVAEQRRGPPRGVGRPRRAV